MVTSKLMALLACILALLAPAAFAGDCRRGRTGADRWEQCGGPPDWKGPTCCNDYNICVKVKPTFWQCQATEVPKGIVPWWGKCGGRGYKGPKVCEPKSVCTRVNRYYSNCVPTEHSHDLEDLEESQGFVAADD